MSPVHLHAWLMSTCRNGHHSQQHRLRKRARNIGSSVCLITATWRRHHTAQLPPPSPGAASVRHQGIIQTCWFLFHTPSLGTKGRRPSHRWPAAGASLCVRHCHHLPPCCLPFMQCSAPPLPVSCQCMAQSAQLSADTVQGSRGGAIAM